MKLTENDVRYVADLANLKLTPDEVVRMTHDLGGILAHMDRLAEIDTEGVEPMRQVLYAASDTATLRHDEAQPSLGAEAALANAPAAGAGYFKIPRVIER